MNASHDECPMTAVLPIPELLQSILLHLDMKTLLHCQRINRQFLATIKNRSKCQRALYFVGENLQRPFKPWMTRVNPLLKSKFPAWFLTSDGLHSTTDTWFPNLELVKHKDMYLRPEASWRRMLVAQPPVSRLCIHYLIVPRDNPPPRKHPHGTVSREHSHASGTRTGMQPRQHESSGETDHAVNDDADEVRMGILYDLTEEFLGKNKQYRVELRWQMLSNIEPYRCRRAADANTLHFTAFTPLYDLWGRGPGWTSVSAPEEKRRMGGGVVHDGWAGKYRSAAFEKLTIDWR